jgi:molecular chaperone Hsp33
LIQLPKDASEIDVGPGAVLQLMRTLPSGRISQGIVQVPESGSISEALMVYMQVSEQVVSMLALATLMGERDVQCAGGYLVQLLPEVGRGPLTVMTERLEGFQSVEQPLREASFTPRRLLDQLLSGMPFTPLEESAVGFGCWCDRLRLLSALATLKRADLTELVASGELLEVRCDYCGLEYQIAPAELRGLLEKS